MALTVSDLSQALRISDGSQPEQPIRDILTRLLGVGEATADLLAPDAPGPVREEAIIRFTAYLYDAPSGAAGQKYSDAWVNSGAAALVSDFVSRRAALPGGAVALPTPAGRFTRTLLQAGVLDDQGKWNSATPASAEGQALHAAWTVGPYRWFEFQVDSSNQILSGKIPVVGVLGRYRFGIDRVMYLSSYVNATKGGGFSWGTGVSSVPFRIYGLA